MINSVIEKHILGQEAKRKNRVRSGKYNPSAFGQCYLRQFWNRKDKVVSDPISLDVLKTFELGKIIHTYVQDKIEGKCEVEISTDDCFGFADVVTDTHVIDIKTVNSRAWKFVQPKKDEDDTSYHQRMNEDKVDNFLQCAFYADFLGKPYFQLSYINKDTFEVIELVRETNLWVNKVRNELDVLRGYWTLDKEPPAMPRLYNGRECRYCQFRSVCDYGKK